MNNPDEARDPWPNNNGGQGDCWTIGDLMRLLGKIRSTAIFARAPTVYLELDGSLSVLWERLDAERRVLASFRPATDLFCGAGKIKYRYAAVGHNGSLLNRTDWNGWFGFDLAGGLDQAPGLMAAVEWATQAEKPMEETTMYADNDNGPEDDNPPPNGSCATCRWAASAGLGDLVCRRNPPSVSLVLSQSRMGVQPVPVGHFPPIQPDQWCGEWQAKLEVVQ